MLVEHISHYNLGYYSILQSSQKI